MTRLVLQKSAYSRFGFIKRERKEAHCNTSANTVDMSVNYDGMVNNHVWWKLSLMISYRSIFAVQNAEAVIKQELLNPPIFFKLRIEIELFVSVRCSGLQLGVGSGQPQLVLLQPGWQPEAKPGHKSEA